MTAFDFTFEELLIDTVGMVDGGCDISFSDPQDFQISDIYLVFERPGLCARLYLKTNGDAAFWLLVHDAIVERYRDWIEERISEEMADG